MQIIINGWVVECTHETYTEHGNNILRVTLSDDESISILMSMGELVNVCAVEGTRCDMYMCDMLTRVWDFYIRDRRVSFIEDDAQIRARVK